MTWYVEIEVLNSEPIDVSPDENGRALLSFNVMAEKEYSETFLEELLKILTDAGLTSSSIFLTNSARIPESGGPYLSMRGDGGGPPERTHNSVLVPAYVRPTAQVLVRSPNQEDASAMAHAAFAALAAIRNTEVTP